MPQSKWKSAGLLGATTLLAAPLLIISLLSLSSLSLLGWSGLLPWVAIVVLAVFSSHFTVTVSNADGIAPSRKSIAETFVFLAAMIYVAPPAETVAPATVLAALVSFLSLRGTTNRRVMLLNAGAAVISTYVAATLYGVLLSLFTDSTTWEGEATPQFGAILLPLCALVAVQYVLSAAITSAYSALNSAKPTIIFSRESLIWTAITQLAGAASATLFYTAWQGGGVAFLFVGLLIIGLIYLLHNFNEQRVEEIRRAEKEKSRHIEEMAALHHEHD